MSIKDKIKALKWLISHQKELEKLLEKKEQPVKKNKNYSLAGVPDYQLDYINDVLEADKNK